MKLWPSSLAGHGCGLGLSSRSRASSCARSRSKRFAIGFGGAERLALRQEKVAGEAVLDGDDVAHLAEAPNALEQDDLHG